MVNVNDFDVNMSGLTLSQIDKIGEMEREYTIVYLYWRNEEEFELVLETMSNYIIESYGCVEDNVIANYFTELAEVLNKGTMAEKWETLLESGIFHDSEGVICYQDKDIILVTTSY